MTQLLLNLTKSGGDSGVSWVVPFLQVASPKGRYQLFSLNMCMCKSGLFIHPHTQTHVFMKIHNETRWLFFQAQAQCIKASF